MNEKIIISAKAQKEKRNKMKKVTILLSTIIMCFGLCACGDAAKQISLGETASTDLAEFTLENAELTYYVDNTIDDNIYKPVEDTDTIWAASKGNCLVALTFTVKNNDRAGSISYCDSSSEWKAGWKVRYNKKTYVVKTFDLNENDGRSPMDLSNSAIINLETDEVIERHGSLNYLIHAGETVTFRTFGIINTEPENLTDEFDFIIQVPTVDGHYEQFIYSIPAKQ